MLLKGLLKRCYAVKMDKMVICLYVVVLMLWVVARTFMFCFQQLSSVKY